jgi:hypothetical protein
MDRGVVILQALRDKLDAGWLRPIQRTTGAHSISFVPHGDGEFSIRVAWKVGDKEQAYEKKFTKAYVLGSSFHRPMLEWRLEKRACDHARDIMRDVLAQRGAL